MTAAHAAGIEAFATGGIGGVHRGDPLDVSADLEELARTPMVVVCAGPKSILDVANTLEVLETRGVPVVTIGQDTLPGFLTRSSGIASPLVAADEAEAAILAMAHLGLGLGSSILVCVPVPAADALPDDVGRDATDRAIREAEAKGIHGPSLTPWILARIADLTDGQSIKANTALITNNAALAGRLARRIGLARSAAAG
jgi:pseudouridine-5'-phosphate glycosidase